MLTEDLDKAKANRERIAQERLTEGKKEQPVPKPVTLARPEAIKLIENLRKEECIKLKKEIKEARLSQAEPNSMTDLECLVYEKSDIEHLRKMLDNWVEALKVCPDDNVRRGIANGLLEFDAYLEVLEKEIQKVFRDD